MSASKVQTPTNPQAFTSILTSVPPDVLIAVSFHTPWAAPCKQMNDVFSALASRDTSSSTVYISVNAEDLADVSEQYNVSAVPLVVLIRNNVELKRIGGANPAELKSALDEAISGGSGSGGAGGVKGAIPPAQSTSAVNNNTSATAGGNEDDGVEEPVEEESLSDRLAKLVSAAPVMLFMKGTPAAPECGFSRQLVGMLRERGIRYGFFNILKDDDVRQGLKKFSDWPTYPQLYHKGELVGGLDIVKERFETEPDFLKDQSINA